jgi:hypothetical protein
MAKPIGIAQSTDRSTHVVVCDDGSVWAYFQGKKWEERDPIPNTDRYFVKNPNADFVEPR